jgi:hypothetical protein
LTVTVVSLTAVVISISYYTCTCSNTGYTPALFTVATAGVADTHGLTAAGVPDPVTLY